jgi:hypothetical protein
MESSDAPPQNAEGFWFAAVTLVTAWVRRIKTVEELVVASDSRLTGGLTWDAGPKLFPLNRGDAVLAFAGDTAFAYPVLLQIMRSMDDFESAANRSVPLEEMKGHLERIVTGLLQKIDDFPGTKLEADFQLLLVGRSVRAPKWRLWTSHIEEQSREFRFHPPSSTSVGAVFLGDGSKAARKLLGDRLRPKRGDTIRLNWEPFDVLRDLIRGSKERTVGGPIQLVKVYPNLTVLPFAVLWPNGSEGRITLLGRELLDHERTQRLAFDPDSHETLHTWTYVRPLVPKASARSAVSGAGRAKGST